jgi:hypothetical protein
MSYVLLEYLRILVVIALRAVLATNCRTLLCFLSHVVLSDICGITSYFTATGDARIG